jgi:pentose-5-phosphate-3-epimerase
MTDEADDDADDDNVDVDVDGGGGDENKAALIADLARAGVNVLVCGSMSNAVCRRRRSAIQRLRRCHADEGQKV